MIALMSCFFFDTILLGNVSTGLHFLYVLLKILSVGFHDHSTKQHNTEAVNSVTLCFTVMNEKIQHYFPFLPTQILYKFEVRVSKKFVIEQTIQMQCSSCGRTAYMQCIFVHHETQHLNALKPDVGNR